MDKVKIRDKEFEKYLTQAEIEAAIDKVAKQMTADLADSDPLFIAILNGSFMFVSELMKRVNIPSELTFIKLASYDGVNSTGDVKRVLALNKNIENRTVIILEDIVDTGNTMDHIIKELSQQHPKEIKVATLLFKPDAVIKKVPLDYVALEIPSDFIVGYGLDYDGYGRNLPDIYKVIN